MSQEEQFAREETEEVDSHNQSAAEVESKEQSVNEEAEVSAEAEQSGEVAAEPDEENEGQEEEEDDDDEEQEGIQSGQRSHREDDEEGQEVEDDEKENEGQPADDGQARKNKKSDLDILLEKQSKERQRNRKKKGDSEELNEMDNVISGMINEMKQVASDDRLANEKSMPALKKLKLLPTVMTLLHKSDYHAAMIELGILGAITEWLSPLPDRSLPNIRIRELLIDALKDFGDINADYLKSSGIGKAVMFLFKHPKEIKAHKDKLEKLIHNWSRPIFNLDNGYKQLTKEERLARDMEHVKTMKRRSNESAQSQSVDEALASQDKHQSKKKAKTSEKEGKEGKDGVVRPGDAAFCPRARVPVPSAKDYIIRPKSSLESNENEPSAKKAKKSETRMDKHQKRFVEIKKNAKTNRAVNLSVTGGK